jgi:GNAT superfamily N-acetyltransferase
MATEVTSRLSVTDAAEADAPSIAALRAAVAEHLTTLHGQGHWSYISSENSVLRTINSSRVLVVRRDGDVVATLYLTTKKPWAIDVDYFTKVERALYLNSMAVAPSVQRQGIGRYLIEEAKAVAQAWPSQAIRLDAYDSVAGAGPFYSKCGFTEVGRVVYRSTPLIYYQLLL